MFERKGKLAIIDPSSIDRILVVGDIHGDLDTLEGVTAKLSAGDLALFLGDYADRGPYGVEVIEGIIDLSRRLPGRILALKGNHEDYSSGGAPLFNPCTLIDEVRRKGRGWNEFFKVFHDFAESLPIAAVIPGFALLVHGGVSTAVTSLGVLSEPKAKTALDVLWSDPDPAPGERLSMRGAGKAFGPDVTEQVLSSLDVRFLIRSHQPRKAVDGPFFEHDDRVVTVNGTREYGGRAFMLVLRTDSLPLSPEDLTNCVEYF